MIVCSQTCFLNVLTQLYDSSVLLDATYYIADLTGPGGVSHLGQSSEDPLMETEEITYKYNDDGQLIQMKGLMSVDTLQRHHVHYMSGALNPESLLTAFSVSLDKGSRKTSEEERFITSLKQPAQMMEVYKDIYEHKLRGNGLQIVIFVNDKLCCKFGWIVCEYLSQCFGSDIIFIDAIYRKKIAKQSKQKYTGNKQFAKELIQSIKNQNLLDSFKQSMTQSSLSGSLNNMTTKLSQMKWQDLINLYNMIWPYNPLPADYYSEERLREIIIHKLMDERQPTIYDKMDNLYAADMFYDMAKEYED